MSENNERSLILVLLAILLPPVAVFLKAGISLHFLLSILLTILGYIPGMIHALWVVLKT
ncbi:MAG: YqaE/Pmp3 family membrane protein [Phycisphaerales bacterium]|nr:YqaE/Pmp3 family membrane protein [Phycisphaerales bacterium]